MNAFDYRVPRTLDEALAILQEYGEEARVIAGGTALVTMMRQRLVRPSYVVSVRNVQGLDRIEARTPVKLRRDAADLIREERPGRHAS